MKSNFFLFIYAKTTGFLFLLLSIFRLWYWWHCVVKSRTFTTRPPWTMTLHVLWTQLGRVGMHWKLIWKSFQHMPTTKHNLISLRIGIPKFLVLKGPEKKQDMKVLHMSGRSERYVADPIIHHAFFLRSESTLCHSELLILGNIFYSILFYSQWQPSLTC